MTSGWLIDAERVALGKLIKARFGVASEKVLAWYVKHPAVARELLAETERERGRTALDERSPITDGRRGSARSGRVSQQDAVKAPPRPRKKRPGGGRASAATRGLTSLVNHPDFSRFGFDLPNLTAAGIHGERGAWRRAQHDVMSTSMYDGAVSLYRETLRRYSLRASLDRALHPIAARMPWPPPPPPKELLPLLKLASAIDLGRIVVDAAPERGRASSRDGQVHWRRRVNLRFCGWSVGAKLSHPGDDRPAIDLDVMAPPILDVLYGRSRRGRAEQAAIALVAGLTGRSERAIKQAIRRVRQVVPRADLLKYLLHPRKASRSKILY
jgi:hypothetical protein